jgi:glycosyltransferase involved in cell wall biosynthesis
MLEAMQAGVPIITSNELGTEELGADTVLLTDPLDPKQIAEQMQLLYKDENLRSNLISKGLENAKSYDWDQSANLFWEEMMATVPV